VRPSLYCRLTRRQERDRFRAKPLSRPAGRIPDRSLGRMRAPEPLRRTDRALPQADAWRVAGLSGDRARQPPHRGLTRKRSKSRDHAAPCLGSLRRRTVASERTKSGVLPGDALRANEQSPVAGEGGQIGDEKALPVPSLGCPLRLSAEHPHQFGTVGWGEGMDGGPRARIGLRRARVGVHALACSADLCACPSFVVRFGRR
jgi:hypothetical protein